MTEPLVMGDVSDGGAGQDTKEDWFHGTYQEQLAKVQVRMERQRYWLRFSACIAAIAVTVGAAVMEWVVLCRILSPSSAPNDLFVFLALAPVASITLIVIFVLVGVFRGYRGKDLADAPTGPLGRMVGGNGS